MLRTRNDRKRLQLIVMLFHKTKNVFVEGKIEADVAQIRKNEKGTE